LGLADNAGTERLRGPWWIYGWGMQDELGRLLSELDAAYQRAQEDGTVDDAERAQMAELVGRVSALLHEPTEEQDGIVEHLEVAAVRFESDHPSVAAVLRSLVGTLTSYGI
jgi:hypothetical protein